MLTTHLLRPGTEPYPGCRLRQLLKRSEHAEVWRAATVEERPLAVKFIPCDDDRALQHDLPFLLAIRQLSHPHLLPIYWVWCYRNYAALGMELARGSLLDLLTDSPGEFRKPVAAPQVCRYLAQAADALDFLNTRQHRLYGKRVAFQHGNIKPSNLLLVGDTVKVTDLKLSSEASFERAPDRLAETLRYAAPEVFGGIVSDRADQYALAVTYCHIRGGRLPFADTPETLDADYARPKPDLTMLPEAERPIIARALASRPEDRWPACGELLEQLTKAATADS
jgi:serine/threonine protein kinase, bacterial